MNTTSAHINTEATDLERYLAAVRAHLADLSPAERDDVLEDLEQHLTEVDAESDEPLAARLGPPDAYAAELRVSAGLAPPGAPRPGPLARIRERAAALHANPRVGPAVAFARDLQPGWWVARGYLAALIWSVLFEAHYAYGMASPIPVFAGRRMLGLLLAVALIVLSVHLGRRAAGSRGYRRLSVAVTAGVALLSLPVLLDLVVQPVGPPMGLAEDDIGGHPFGQGALLSGDGRLLTNIYPYDAEGEPLTDVRLYDQDGQPLEIILEFTEDGRPVVTSYPLANDGTPVTNAYPQRQAVRNIPGWQEFDVGPHDTDIGGQPFGERPDITVPPMNQSSESDNETDADTGPEADTNTG